MKSKEKTPIVRRPVVDDIVHGRFASSTLMHMVHYDMSAQLMISEAKRLGRPIDVMNVGAGDLWDLIVLVNGTIITKSDVLASYTAVDYEYRESPFGKTLSEIIAYKCIAKDLEIDPTIDVEDCTIDFVVCTEFIEHVSRDSGISILDEIYHILKPGGLIYITTPNVVNSTHTDRYHIYEWELHELLDELAVMDFIVETYYGAYIDQRKFAKANAEHMLIPESIVAAIKTRFTPNFSRMFLATVYPDYSKGIVIHARKPE